MKDFHPDLATFSKEDLKKLVETSDGVEIFYLPFNASCIYKRIVSFYNDFLI